MKKTLLLMTTLTALATASAQSQDPQTLMTTRGKLLLADPLSAVSKTDWKAAKGEWTIVDGALQGAELSADNHPATYRRALSFQDAVIQFDFNLNGAKLATFSLNDAQGHVARVLLDAKGFLARKDDHDHEGDDKAVNFNQVAVPLKANQWSTMLIEIRGSEMLARVVGEPSQPLEKMGVSFGTAELIGAAKTNLGFTVAGSRASFRNLRVYEGLENPAWGQNKKILESALKR
jgi:hypothetical protein